jgi:AraC-like DNA-binding protein
MPLKTLNTLLRVVIEQGYPLEQALEQIGLDFNPLLPENQQRQEVPTSCYSKLYRLLMELLQDEAFGLGQEYHAPPGTFRMMCLFIIHCPTLHQALIRSWEFHDYCNQYRGIPRRRGSRPVVYLDNGESALCLFQRSVSSEQDRDFVGHANVLLMMFRFYSWLIGKRLPLQAVHLRARAPASSKHYEQLFGCEVRFEQANSGLLIPAGVLQYPVAQNEESLREFLRQAPYQLVKHEQPASVQSLTRRIEQLLSQYASQKLPNADEVARQLNMSPRTLHRKLTAEDTSFQQLKDRFRTELFRTELAVHYVSRPELTIDAIATLMGFQDNSAFYRSFKKWTGVSPGQFRRELGGDGGARA